MLSHPHYNCAKYAVAGDPNRLGLTLEEVAWLDDPENARSPKGRELIGYYQMVAAAPGDPGARAFFAAALETWRRRSNTRPVPRTES